MSSSRKVLAAAVVCAAMSLSACGGGKDPQSGEVGEQQQGALTGWTVPSCTKVIGTNAITFTKDEGATLTPVSGTALSGVAYTHGLVALDTPNTMLASHNGKLLKSTNAGCNWTQVNTLDSVTLTAAQGGRAYGWAENGSSLYRIDGASTLVPLVSPVSNILGLGVDPANGLHVRVGDSVGQLYESFNGGVSWTAVGVPAATGDLVLGYTVAFDPSNLDKVFYGQAGGARVSTNGGATWTSVTGLSTTRANAFTIVVSPADNQVVWLEAMDLTTEQRHIYRSTNGGLSFAPVVTESADVTLTNGILLVAHPTNANVIYFEFGTHFQQYGTDIYKYDHAVGTVTKTHNANDGVSSIAFSPASPSVLYFGLTSTN
ncbi:dispase autolysis-inducing protein [Pyxidicoccus fallax]|uniref:Dispase autolysis-inducing protein n=1 Tax=Pyxidicoccus fallax TaxID=394095 RepID=A0A848L2Y6_9BACT|nr:dispase autolysis-inducing protein [Pyxidicoccus fallax]NMO13270.1 dispase autolysis-inducing protein [Pyxidicoccus fallax]NPC77176.1 dispase autolysis-inducing protein [Pyxidicoccus fallax]